MSPRNASALTVTPESTPRAKATLLPADSFRLRTWQVAVGLLLLVHLSLGVDCAFRFSVTHDEYWHLPAGLAVLKYGRFDADNLNPPLSRAWSALPLAILRVQLGEGAAPNDSTTLGDRFLAENLDRYHKLYAYARLMNLAWSVLAGLVIAAWGRDMYGEGAAVVGAALWFLCPVVLSNAALVTPDLSSACSFVATTYAAWRWAQAPSCRRALAVGVLLGLAQLAKFTCIVLYPIVIAVWLVVRYRSQSTRLTVRCAAGQSLLGLVVSLFMLNAGYLFQGTGRPLNSYQFKSHGLANIVAAAHPMIGAVLVPAPRDYVAGFDRQRSIMEVMHPVFLDGAWNIGEGFRDYYLRACIYKWSHATQALVLTSLVSFLFWRVGRRLLRDHAAVLLPAALIVGIASMSHMQLGIRYILPAFPLVYLFAGHVGTWLTRPRWSWRKIWVTACLPALLIGLRYHPHHLAYFNELSGGPVQGREHLLDSNIDWGQDLRGLQEYLRDQKIETLRLAYFGMVPPARLGISYHLPPSDMQVRSRGSLPAGWYAVSINFVQGRPHTIRDFDDEVRSVGLDEFGYFRRFVPVARIGWSIDVYRIVAAGSSGPDPLDIPDSQTEPTMSESSTGDHGSLP